MDSTQRTHRDLQQVLSSPLLIGLVDFQQIFLLGFSQGGLHAILLAAEHPDRYSGVVAVSPGGPLYERMLSPPIDPRRSSSSCVFIHGAEEPHSPIAEAWGEACKAAGWKFRHLEHDGGHHFPENWDAVRPSIAAFLTAR